MVPDQPGIRTVNGLWRPTYDRFVRTRTPRRSIVILACSRGNMGQLVGVLAYLLCFPSPALLRAYLVQFFSNKKLAPE